MNAETSAPLMYTLKAVSPPFDAGYVVELKFDVEGPFSTRGELYLRVPADEAHEWKLGDKFGSRLRRL
jgi:hypothetical protein